MKESGIATWMNPDWVHCANCWTLDAMWTVMPRKLGAVVAHHFRFKARVMACGDTEVIS